MRKTSNIILYIYLLFSFSCEIIQKDLNVEIPEGFRLEIDDSIVYYSNQIEFYDISSHLIYIKEDYSFLYDNIGSFKVFIDSLEIYTGIMHPHYSSQLPEGAVIECAPSFYNNYIIPIEFYNYINTDGSIGEDPRGDQRIIEALQRNNQYKNGLACEILTVEKVTNGKIRIDLELTNNSVDKLLYLDPDKTGLELFHYFTHGLIFRDLNGKFYLHQLSVTGPEQRGSWNIEWFSSINSMERKIVSILYDSFETIPDGLLQASFSFPGPNRLIEKDDLQQGDGRIWLGEIQVFMDIEIK